MKQKIILSTILICCLLAFAGSERGYGFLMLEEPLNARNISMGSTGTALGGSGFRYYNPASPFFSAHPYTSIEFGQMPGGVNKGGFESALIFPQWFTALGFYSSGVDFETRDERGFGSTASSSTTTGSLGGGFIRERLAVGISVLMVQDRIWIYDTYNAFTLSGGLGYKLFDGKLNLGAAGFHGIAKSNGFGDSASVWHDGLVPRFARAGAAWMDTVKTFPFTITTDVVYRDENATVSVPVGAEVWILPSIALRIGKRIGWESEIFSIGLGLNIDKLSFDAAFVPSVLVDDYELKWSMGLRYDMGGRRKKDRAVPPVTPQEEFDRQDESGSKRDQLEDEQGGLDKQEPVAVDEVTIDDEIDEASDIEGEQESVIADEVIGVDGEDSKDDENKQDKSHEEIGVDEQEAAVGDDIVDADD